MKIALLYGGKSTEHEVSVVSAASVARGLRDAGFETALIGITKRGEWFLFGEEETKNFFKNPDSPLYINENGERVAVLPGAGRKSFLTKSKNLEVDVVFPVLHGSYGEDGTVQGLLEMAGVPYVGATVLSSSLTMDKEKTKILVESAGIKTVPYKCITKRDMMDSSVYDKFFSDCLSELSLPLFVKPANAGSSKGAMKVKTKKEFSYALMMAATYDHKILVEKAIEAREIECSVTGNSVSGAQSDETERVRAYIPGEIVVHHEFYDYDAKYNDASGASLLIPAPLSSEETQNVKRAAVAAYKALDLTGLSRVDFFIEKSTGTLYFNEANSMPGFTSISMFAKMCAASSLDFRDLLKLLIREALALHKAKAELDRGDS